MNRHSILAVIILALVAVSSCNGADEQLEFFLLDGAGMVGIRLLPDDPRAVREVLPDSPAARANIQEGDYLFALDGKSTKDLNLSELIAAIRGPADTELELSVWKASSGAVVAVRLRRTKLTVFVRSRTVFLIIRTTAAGGHDSKGRFPAVHRDALAPGEYSVLYRSPNGSQLPLGSIQIPQVTSGPAPRP